MRTFRVIESPVGPLTAVSTDGVLSRLFMAGAAHLPDSFGEPSDDGAGQLESELAEYFAGGRREFTVPTAAVGTVFQHRVWAQLTEIPYGSTRSYLDLALALGDARLVRAVGAANGRNPLSIIVPCHRVVGSDGTLTGYAGGIARKEQLLAIEDPRRLAEVLF
ncbi:methylated-DNA--[protein]-cysteine S-methyltransferase [Sanguibacter inulinus]|uniref:Methylated-DNA--protein-cysteine methyltransferase n=1 Tax=Sanguibacter inulinus TaxID=60922 RepID=A0A853ETR0_9MICO|nr:methylated-DNA--[protein]-cysteine S-methyltransferase [Sanguibacter inulinus]MBF0722742.1 methylated-DNA--[protein]-cysteine S-methyltransferase [Sanguibacter inulinus]NYS93887.1 methylated-DNA--[protein]-cysteine S-methyltransferase [Sanguibacter inulinus]